MNAQILAPSNDYLLVLINFADCEVDVHLWLEREVADVRIYRRDIDPPHYCMLVWHRLDLPLSRWMDGLSAGLAGLGLGRS